MSLLQQLKEKMVKSKTFFKINHLTKYSTKLCKNKSINHGDEEFNKSNAKNHQIDSGET